MAIEVPFVVEGTGGRLWCAVRWILDWLSKLLDLVVKAVGGGVGFGCQSCWRWCWIWLSKLLEVVLDLVVEAVGGGLLQHHIVAHRERECSLIF